MILIVAASGCVQEGDTPAANMETQDNVQREQGNSTMRNNNSAEITPCDQACINFCTAHPNTPGPAWDKLIPPGSAKNCKTILEEELGLSDLSECEDCKCMCFFEENGT